MKKLLILLMVVALAACNGCGSSPWHTRTVTPREAAASIFRVDVTVTLQKVLPPPSDDGSDDDDVPPPPPVTQKWRGTAWIADSSMSHTTLVTAGHVCETRDSMMITPMLFGLIPTGDPVEYNITGVTYKFLGRDGTVYEGGKALVKDGDSDLCVLTAPGALGAPLGIADQDPNYGDTGWLIGAPHGMYGAGVAPMFQATFVGRGNPFAGRCEDEVAKFCEEDELAFSGMGFAGNSGSPVIVGGRVVSTLNVGGSSGTWIGSPWNKIRAILRQALHRIQDE